MGKIRSCSFYATKSNYVNNVGIGIIDLTYALQGTGTSGDFTLLALQFGGTYVDITNGRRFRADHSVILTTPAGKPSVFNDLGTRDNDYTTVQALDGFANSQPRFVCNEAAYVLRTSMSKSLYTQLQFDIEWFLPETLVGAAGLPLSYLGEVNGTVYLEI